MIKQPIALLPYIIAATCGFALVIVGAAMRTDVSNDWLAFAGSLLGSGIAALVGFWLLVLQEQRQDQDKHGKVAEAMTLIHDSVLTLVEAGRGNNTGHEAEGAVETLRINAAAATLVIRNFGVTKVSTLAALQELMVILEGMHWGPLAETAHYADTVELFSDGEPQKSENSSFDGVAHLLLPAIHRVQATLD